jgi:translation initiation factor IF-2
VKLSELAKEKGYSAAELVFVARAFGLEAGSTKDVLDVRTVALWRARVLTKAQLKKERPDLLERLKEGSQQVREAERAAAPPKRSRPPRPRAPKKTKEPAAAATAAATAPPAAAEPVPAPKSQPAPAAAPQPKPAPPPKEKEPPRKPAPPAPPPARRKPKAVEIPLKERAPAPPPPPPPKPIPILRDTPKVAGTPRGPRPPIEEKEDEKLRVLRPVVIEEPERDEGDSFVKAARRPKAPVPSKAAPPPRPPAALLRGLRHRPASPPAAERKVVLSVPITIRDFSQQAGIKASEILAKLLANGVKATINSLLDEDAVLTLALEFQREIEIKKTEAAETRVLEAQAVADRPEDLVPRPPVVTVMGHVDHGKTTLLDRIRQTRVAEGEAGGITQHIGAYQATTPGGRRITFIDTPGHEAFTKMRARGAHVTDIVVLVVAADDGVMPQTREAVDHARAAGVPIIVAVNKTDLPNANLQKVYGQLAEMDLAPEEWGGKTVTVPISARTGQGVNDLLELIVLQADLLELKSNPRAPAEGVVLEARKETGRGIVATLLVQRGTLKRGSSLVCGGTFGRIRSLTDDLGRSVSEAPPSMPVEVTGFEELPEAGDRFQEVSDLRDARSIAQERKAREAAGPRPEAQKVTLENLFDRMAAGAVKELRLVLKTDVKGSAEVLTDYLSRIRTDELRTQIVHAGVGPVTESDVMLAEVSGAVIVAFQTDAEARAKALAKEKGIQIRRHTVIYELVEEVKASLEGMLEPEEKEVTVGRAEVLEIFSLGKHGNVAGCLVRQGRIARNALIRLWRGGKTIFSGRIASLRRFKDDVREVEQGLDCGIRLEGWNDFQKGDLIEAYTIERVPRRVFAR